MQYGIARTSIKVIRIYFYLLGPDVMLNYFNLSLPRNLFPVKSSGFKISLGIVRWIYELPLPLLRQQKASSWQ